MDGELPIPRNFQDIDALGKVMKVYNTTKIWAAVVDGDLGLQNGDGNFRNYYTNEILGKLSRVRSKVSRSKRMKEDGP